MILRFRTAMFCMVVGLAVEAHSANYYLSPTGSDGNTGTSSSSPWLTFAHAINVARASCGDTLILLDGTYGNTTSTGNMLVSGHVCTLGNELTIRAQNSRQAKILDNGTGQAVRTLNSAYIILDGLYTRSTDNSGATGAGQGDPFRISSSNHVQIKNSMGVNPNRYTNSHIIDAISSQDILVEDFEGYIFHRHCVMGFKSERMVVRRAYCNPRGGRIPGGFGLDQGAVGTAGTLFSLYPCKDCVLENSIGDGTTTPMQFTEMNASYNGGILMSGSKMLGSICYKCNAGNPIYPQSRGVADLNHAPQNLLIRDVAIVDWNGTGQGIKCDGCVNMMVDHVTILGAGTAMQNGIQAKDVVAGGTAAQNSIFVTNTIVSGIRLAGLTIEGHNTWSGNKIYSYNNGTAFNPPPPANWTNTATTNPGLGTCKVWVPAGAAVKGAGTGGSDIGATILYRYTESVLTTVPLWDSTTGEFPHGAADPDGINRVAGESIDSIHTRLNINTGGCSFPSDYGGGGGSTTVSKGTTADSGLSTTATPLTWNHTITASQDYLTACIGLHDTAGNVGSASGVTVGGNAMTLLKREVTSPAYRAAELWGRAAPPSGVQAITATLTGAITGALGRSIEFDATSGPNTAVSVSANTGSSLSVTAPTNTNELLIDCTVSSKAVTYTHGTDQTGETDLLHASVSLLLAVSTQNGSLGGVMSNSTGSSVYQAKVAVSLIAGTPDPPSGSTFRVTNYRLESLHGSIATPEVALSALAVDNTPGEIGVAGAFRLRVEILVETATSSETGIGLQCRETTGGYARVHDTFGSGVIRFYGADLTPTIPPSLTSTTQRFSGTFVPGRTLRDAASSLILPVMSSGTRTEVDFEIVAGNGLVADDDVECQIITDVGVVIGTHTVTPAARIVSGRALMGF